MINVMLCEDDYLVREGARTVLELADDIVVDGAAGDPTELLELFEKSVPNAVVLDIRMPPTFTTEGIDLARQLHRDHPGLGIVVLSQHADPEYALELLQDGSDGFAYLLKERLGDADRLVAAIREVVDGGSVLDQRIVEGLLEARRRRSASKLAGLSERELEVLSEMAIGKGNSAIAESLSITDRSVEKHTNSIFRKLGLRENLHLNRRVAAVLFYLQRGED